jgi:hypothetical protein
MANARLAGRFRWVGAGPGWRGRKSILQSKTPELFLARAVYLDISLTMSYFHTGTRTIIGAEAFHFPVRDGKEWDHLAMVIRLNWTPRCSHEHLSQIMEFESYYDCFNRRGQTPTLTLVKVIGSSLTGN